MQDRRKVRRVRVRDTLWRAVVLDFHICSPECLVETRELLEHAKPLNKKKAD